MIREAACTAPSCMRGWGACNTRDPPARLFLHASRSWEGLWVIRKCTAARLL